MFVTQKVLVKCLHKESVLVYSFLCLQINNKGGKGVVSQCSNSACKCVYNRGIKSCLRLIFSLKVYQGILFYNPVDKGFSRYTRKYILPSLSTCSMSSSTISNNNKPPQLSLIISSANAFKSRQSKM